MIVGKILTSGTQGLCSICVHQKKKGIKYLDLAQSNTNFLKLQKQYISKFGTHNYMSQNIW